MTESEKLIKAAQEYKVRHSRLHRFCPSLCTPISAASCARFASRLAIVFLVGLIIWIPFKVVQGCNRAVEDVATVGAEAGMLVVSWAESWAEGVQEEARERRIDLTASTIVKYNSLRIGMSYSEVVAIFGKVKLMSSNGNIGDVTCTWEQYDYVGGRLLNRVFVVFENMTVTRYYSQVFP